MRVMGRRRERTENTDHKKHLPSARGAAEQESSSGSSLHGLSACGKVECSWCHAAHNGMLYKGSQGWAFFRWMREMDVVVCCRVFFRFFFCFVLLLLNHRTVRGCVGEFKKRNMHPWVNEQNVHKTYKRASWVRQKKTTRKRFSPWPLLVVSVYNEPCRNVWRHPCPKEN